MRVSVLIPCYNAAPYLGEALESALRQRPAPFEIVVMDDGSTDGSAAIAERFGAPVRWYRQPNQGICATRNRLLQLARGALIAFLDADDLWTPASLEHRVAVLEAAAGTDVVGGLVEEFFSPELSKEALRGVTKSSGPMAGRLAGSLVIRREVFDRVGLFNPDYNIGEMIDWISRANSAGVVLQQLDQVVLRRRIHLSNTGIVAPGRRSDYLRVLRHSLARQRGKRAREGSE